MSALPLHLQVLQALTRRIESRQRELEGRVGTGLDDREYQRHVGRIAELKQVQQQVRDLMKGGLNQIEDEEESLREAARQRRAQVRRAAGH